jgi:hypothetical protein
VLGILAELFGKPALNQPHARRLRNQADFYSLFGAVAALQESGQLPKVELMAKRLGDFSAIVSDENQREMDDRAKRYFQAARSASNDLRQRRTRISILTDVILGKKTP